MEPIRRRRPPWVVALALSIASGAAGAAGPGDGAGDGLAGREVSAARLRATVTRLVGFGTRHTLSAQDDPVRGIGAARAWAAGTFRAISAGCGQCLELTLPESTTSGARIPAPVRLVDVVAVQRGSVRPDEVVIIAAHIDSRASDVMDATSDAPGANDDGSGTALVIEAARVLSARRFPATIVYALLSGEEQGLYGGKLLADQARARGWTVKAVLNNDIVGNTRGSDGLVDAAHVRVFSEGPRGDADAALAGRQRAMGGENDSPSRNLSRFIAALPETGNGAGPLAVRQVWRADRAGRGGDHLPFEEAGFPAVRLSVAVENYDHQHQDVRVDKGVRYGDLIAFMDFDYLRRVTALNVAVAARLAAAPMPPVASANFAVRTFTEVAWKPVAGAAGYTVWRRRTDARDWTMPVRVPATATSLKLPGVRGDDWFFGVSARGADGAESPVSSALPGGGFAPWAGGKPEPAR
ncbi:MAG: M28 family peptidase [Sphingomonadales bacterium]|nr:M28 family peptidase [Sphingomonadales bacterium]